MDKRLLKQRAFRFLSGFGDNMHAKFSNICGKTGQYSVPNELFQKRTPRKNRILIPWSTVKSNKFTLEQLNTFEGGVVVEFVNNDFFDADNRKFLIFEQLTHRIGSDENVSAIISIRSESGSSSSAIQREAFTKLINNTPIEYDGCVVNLNPHNYSNYAINQVIQRKGQGNETWDGFLYVSIRGGQQDTIETHRGQELTLFNPACEYASADVCEDINLVMAYYVLMAIDEDTLRKEEGDRWREYKLMIKNIETELMCIEYNHSAFSGNLYDYVKNNYSVSMIPGQLTDPIQVKRIDIASFNISERTEDSIDFTHDEAVIHDKFYWDKKKKCILSPARPTNVFWSYHLSNMMQQNYNLAEYFEYEEQRLHHRQKLIGR